MLETFPLIEDAWTSLAATAPFSGLRLAMMTWYLSEAEAMTFDAAKPTPELAPGKYRLVGGHVLKRWFDGRITRDQCDN